MPSFCVVSNCELKYSHSENISFHKFPFNNPRIMEQWIKFTGRGLNWKPSRWSSICSRHFDASDFREYLSRKCLKRNAIPTILMKNNISYETYHINNPSEYTRENQLDNEVYEMGITSESTELNNGKLSYETNCRLCGERNDAIGRFGTLDDYEIDIMFRKCLPTITLHTDIDCSRVLCSECISQLKQYSDFVDRVLSYQKELVPSENPEHSVINEKHIPFEKSMVNSNINSMFIKQEPINVKQEKVENSNRKPQEIIQNFQSTFTVSNTIHQGFDISHIKPRSSGSESVVISEREQMNNCEIMEIITLNNPVSFIDLDEDDPCNMETERLKTENLSDMDRRFEIEHAYAKRTTNALYHLKQEIVDAGNEENEQSNVNSFDQYVNTYERNSNEASSNKIICVQCQRMFPSQYLLDDHVNKMHMLKRRTCPFCAVKFNSIYEYLRHKTITHGSICVKCKRKFNSNPLLKKHEKFCTRKSSDYFFSCRHCSKKIASMNQMWKHLKHCIRKRKEITEPIDLLSKSQESSTATKYSKICKPELGKYVCSYCYRTFLRFKNFNEHQEMHVKYNHKNDPKLVFVNDVSNTEQITPPKSFKAVVGDSKFIFLNESCDKTTPTIESHDSPSLQMSGIFVCENCGKQFPTFIKLNQHKAAHDVERKFNCSLCPKTFKGISGLKQHISGFHYKIKPYKCPICFYPYALKGDMLRCRHSRSKIQKIV